VAEHEMHHVEITSRYWDAFVNESMKFEGCYCVLSCVTTAINIVKAALLLNQWYAVRDNAIFDLQEYGERMGGDVASRLYMQYNEALKNIPKAQKAFDQRKKEYQEEKCTKISL